MTEVGPAGTVQPEDIGEILGDFSINYRIGRVVSLVEEFWVDLTAIVGSPGKFQDNGVVKA